VSFGACHQLKASIGHLQNGEVDFVDEIVSANLQSCQSVVNSMNEADVLLVLIDFVECRVLAGFGGYQFV
jgi:hypothetical protein